MPDEVGKLQIQIESSAKGASDGLEKLVTSLEGLKTALSGAQIRKLERVQTALSGLASASANMKTAGSSIRSAANALSKMSEALDKIDTQATSRLSKVTSALQKLDGEKLKGVGSAVKRFSMSMQEIAPALASMTDADFSNLDRVTSSLERLQGIDLRGVATAIKSVGDKTKETGKSENIEKLADSIREVDTSKASEQIDKIKFSLSSVGSIAGTAASAIGKVFDRLTSPATGMLQDMVGSLSAIGNVFGSISAAARQAGSAIKAAFSKSIVLSPLRKAGEAISGFKDKLNNLARAFKRVLFYRTVRTLIKQIGDAFKTGINDLYQYSKAFGGTFAQSMDMASTSMLYFKNSVGAAISPLINYFAPMLDQFIDHVVSALNVLNQFLARITGAQTWTKALKYQKEYADATKATGNAAKEAMKYLAPFDELNVLPSESGSGSGGGGSALDYSQMFEEANFDSQISDFADKLKQAIKSGDWKGVGTLLGEKINSIFPPKSKWEAWGATFGDGLKAVINSAYYALKTIDFSTMGNSISGFVNSALTKALSDTGGGSAAENLGRLLIRTVTSGLDFLAGFLRGLDWRLVGTALSDYLSGAWNEAAEWINSYDWGEVARNLQQDLKDLFSGIDGEELGKSLSELFTALFNGLADFFLNFDVEELSADLADLLGRIIVGVKWSDVLLAMARAIGAMILLLPDEIAGPIKWATAIFVQNFREIGEKGIEGWFQGILEKLKGAWTWLKEHFVDPVVEWVKNLFGIHSPSTVFASIGENIVDGLWEGIQDSWSRFIGFFQGLWDDLKSWWENLSLGIFHIPTPRFEWTYTQASGLLAKALEFVGLPATIPHLNISWMARGGIVDGATLIGAGEAGKEAIVPLERNTEWIVKVAAEMNEQRAKQGRYGNEMSAAMESANEPMINAIYAIGSQIVEAIVSNGGGGSDIDWNGLARKISKYQSRQTRAGNA